MSKRFHSLTCLGLLSVILLSATDALAMKDKDNQGRWEKPTKAELPDKEVPGFLINLGPTGARAVLTDKTFIVRYIFKDSPAVNRLKLDDVITGAFGKPFGTHTFGGGYHGYEGPIMDLGMAIEQAEGKDGKLVLNVQRGSEKTDVTIDLEPIGTFGATFPVGCKKSEVVRARALKYLAEHPDALKGGGSHTRMVVALALLTSDEPKQFAAGKAMILKWNDQKPDDRTWSWDLAHPLIALSEYHLLTKDAAVLPTMKMLAEALDKSQWKTPVKRWKVSEFKVAVDQATLDRHQDLYDGGFGHCPYPEVVARGGGGYGPMQYPAILAVTGWQLAAQCGVKTNPDTIKRSLDFIHRGTNEAGYVAYGGEFTLNNGPVDSVAWKKSKGGNGYAGRAGASIIAHKLSPEFAESADYADLNQRYVERAYRSIPDGHAEPNLGILWGIMGAAVSGDEKVLRTVLDYHKAFFNMMRCHDGSFVLLPGRDYADEGYYTSPRYHPTGTLALAYGLGHPKLMIQGIKVTDRGPKAPKGKKEATETPAKPQAAAPKAAVSPEALAEWQARFVKKLDAVVKAGAKLNVDLGDNQRYLVRGATEKSLVVSLQGNELPMAWTWLSAEHRAALAKSAATDDDVEALLIAAVLNLACNRKDQADELLAKAAQKDAVAVKVAKATLGK